MRVPTLDLGGSRWGRRFPGLSYVNAGAAVCAPDTRSDMACPAPCRRVATLGQGGASRRHSRAAARSAVSSRPARLVVRPCSRRLGADASAGRFGPTWACAASAVARPCVAIRSMHGE